jgi:hypothetical protein
VAFALLALPLVAAAEEVDPRWRYVTEAGVGVGLTDALSNSNLSGVSTGSGGLTWLVRAAFYAPVGENRQLGGGLLYDGRGHATLAGEFRWQQDFADPRIVTRLTLGALMDVSPNWALGPSVGAGGGFEFRPGWRVGADLRVGLLFGALRTMLAAEANVAYLF